MCTICSHKLRESIENDLVLCMSGDSDVTFEVVADKYKVPVSDLKVHALMHVSLEASGEKNNSIVQKIKLDEASILRDVANEYLVTLRTIGQRIKSAVNQEGETGLVKIQKPVVDLYLGCGAEIRNTTETLIRLNQAINGDQNSSASALANLVQVLGTSSGKE